MGSMGGVGRRGKTHDEVGECGRKFNDGEASLQRSAKEIEYSTLFCWLKVRAR